MEVQSCQFRFQSQIPRAPAAWLDPRPEVYQTHLLGYSKNTDLYYFHTSKVVWMAGRWVAHGPRQSYNTGSSLESLVESSSHRRVLVNWAHESHIYSVSMVDKFHREAC